MLPVWSVTVFLPVPEGKCDTQAPSTKFSVTKNTPVMPCSKRPTLQSYSCNHCFSQIVVICGECGEMFRILRELRQKTTVDTAARDEQIKRINVLQDYISQLATLSRIQIYCFSLLIPMRHMSNYLRMHYPYSTSLSHNYHFSI